MAVLGAPGGSGRKSYLGAGGGAAAARRWRPRTSGESGGGEDGGERRRLAPARGLLVGLLLSLLLWAALGLLARAVLTALP
jgi:hypothetical protein